MKEFRLSVQTLFSGVCIFILMQCTTSANAFTNTEKTLIIGPETADCTGVMPMKCLQIKENTNGTWTNLYTNIEGFTYEPGYEYILKVKEEKIKHPPADGSSIQYILIREISKIKK